MSERHQVQLLVGYTDGKPSWSKIRLSAHKTWSREAAEKAVRELFEQHPTETYRIRKVVKRR